MVEKSLAEPLRALLQPALEKLGLELVGIAWHPRPDSSVLRITVDRPGGVTLEECGRASQVASLLLDRHDSLFPGAYLLEVSSPGAEHSLETESDFTRALGRRVRLELEQDDPELHQVVEGKLLALGPAALDLEVRRVRGGRARSVQVERRRIRSARVVVDI